MNPGATEFENIIHSHRLELQADHSLALELYNAMCNVIWKHDTGFEMSYSWRCAGALVASTRGPEEDYLDYYCSGGEGSVSSRIVEMFSPHGWTYKDYDEAA